MHNPSPQNLEFIDFPQQSANAMLNAAIVQYGGGRFDSAETILQGLLAIESNNPRALKLLGSMMVLQERDDEALALYQKALTLDPEDPYTLVALAELELNAMRLWKAVDLLEILFDLDPHHRHPATMRARALLQEVHQSVNA